MRPTLAAEASQRLNADLSAAIADFEKSPTEDNVVWVGRRLAYLGRFRDSIDWYTKQLERLQTRRNSCGIAVIDTLRLGR